MIIYCKFTACRDFFWKNHRSTEAQKIYRLIFCASVLLWFVSAAIADDSFAHLKEQYLKLRNTDPHIKRENDWRVLSSKFVDYADLHPKTGEAATALFNASILQVELSKILDNEDDRELAKDYLNEIIDSYDKSPLQDDSLKLLSDIYQEEKDDDAFEETLKKLITEFPDSEYADYAKAKLSGVVTVEKKFAHQNDSITVVLDPGHGGEDFGAVGVGELLEKDVTLAVALSASEKLQKKGIRAVLTRSKDEFMPLQRRTEIANAEKAALFVSIHVNASPNGTLSGLETYYVDNSGDKASKALAERENTSGGDTGLPDDLQMMLSDLIQQAKTPESIEFAKVVSKHIEKATKGFDVGKNHGVKKAPFYVLVGAHMPAVLVELFFINNQAEGSLLLEKDFREALSVGLSDAILEYIKP